MSSGWTLLAAASWLFAGANRPGELRPGPIVDRYAAINDCW